MKKGFALPIIIIFSILLISSVTLLIKSKFSIPREVTTKGTVTSNYPPKNEDDYASFILKKEGSSNIEVIYHQGKNSCANKNSEELGATLREGDKVEIKGMDYGTSIQICAFSKYYIKLLEKGPPPTPSPAPTPAVQSNPIVYQLDFVSSKGINKKLTIYSNQNGQDIYIGEGEFNKQKATKVIFKEPFPPEIHTPITPSLGLKKYFYVIGQAGDSLKSAIIGEDGQVVNENIDVNVLKAIQSKYNEKCFCLSFGNEQWNGSDSFSVRYAAYAQHDHEFKLLISANGTVESVEKIKNK